MKLFLIVSVSFMAFATLSYFVVRSEMRSAPQATFNTTPLLEIRDFNSKLYSADILDETFNYKYGYLEEPNQFVITNQYKWKSLGNEKEALEVRGEKMVVSFLAKTLVETIAGQGIDDIEFDDGISIITRGHILKSQRATYYASEDLFIGTDPVYITGEDTRIHATDGFKVELEAGNFELFGNVNGVFENAEFFK